MKHISILVTALLISSVGLVGCGNSTSKTTSASENLLETIKSQGKIQIGTEGTYAPYTFHDKSGKLTGFDVDKIGRAHV